MKASLDVNSIKEFATNHVEKFVFGGVVLLLLLFAIRAVQTVGDRPFAPDELKDVALQAKQAMAKTTWPDYLAAHPELEYEDFVGPATRIVDPIPSGGYQPPPGLVYNPPEFPQRNKRGVPGLIALEGLRAAGGNGALQMSANPEGMAMTRGARGSRWVVVTGLLPIKKQMDAYDAVFEDAVFRDPRRDVPIYVGYWIERAEVSPIGTAQQPDWKRIAPQDAFGVMRYWGASGSRQMVVHQKYLPRRAPQGVPGVPMVFPLPPRVNAMWDSTVVHPPEIPLLIDMPLSERGLGFRGRPAGEEGGEETEDAQPGEEQREAETEPSEELSPFGPMVGPGMPRGRYGMEGGPGMGYPGGGMYPGGAYPGGAYPGGTYPGGGYESETYDQTYEEEGGYMGGYPTVGPGMRRPGMVSRVEEVIEYQLFRFFDFDVEPGRRYQYQVRLFLLNPNYQVESRFLEKEDLGKKWWVETEWSEPSNVVKVPRDSRLLAGTVKPPREHPGIFSEPSAKVIAVTLRMEDGLESSEEYTVLRGHLANFEGKLVQQRAAGPYGMGAMPGGYEDMEEEGMYPGMYPGYGEEEGGPRRPTRRPAAAEEEEPETISHATELTVLDMTGGDRLHRSDGSLTEPSSLLLVDADGNLLVQNELDDLEEFGRFHVPEEPRRPTRERRRPGEGMYGEEMEGMYGGMEEMYGEGPTPRRGRRRGRRSYEEE